MYQVPQIEPPVHSSDEPQETRIRRLEESIKGLRSTSALRDLAKHDREHTFIDSRMRELEEEGKDKRAIKRAVVGGLILSGFAAVWTLIGYGLKYWIKLGG